MNEMMTRPACACDFETAPARLTIDLGAIVANWRHLAALAGPARTAAVVKADAYGLGAPEVGRVLATAGCRDFFVATPDEGAVLRNVLPERRIFVLNGVWPGFETTVLAHDLIPVIASLEQLSCLLAAAPDHPFALYVDTGMNRLGLTAAEAVAYAASGGPMPVLVVSHLACSDDPSHPMNRRQRESFQAVMRPFAGIESSLSSSAGIFLGADYHCDLTRPGIALYGGEAVGGVANPMRPVVTAEARVLQIRHVRKGDAASYGACHVFNRDSRIAIVGAGYADGWHRALSGAGVGARRDGSPGAEGFIAGRRVPLVGRVTMDLTLFDIGDLAEGAVRSGDYIELFGHNIALDDAARAAGTIGYELLTSLGSRYARRYM
jgi:alanine racemase